MKLVGMPLEDIIKCLQELKEIQAVSAAVCPHPVTQRRMDALNDSIVYLSEMKSYFDFRDELEKMDDIFT